MVVPSCLSGPSDPTDSSGSLLRPESRFNQNPQPCRAVDDAAALGVTPGQLKGLQKQLANRDASVKQQLQEAAEAKSEKERKRTPESEAERSAGLENFKQ